jgi:Protein of unknown function DUF262/Protein of unknown function (DUF1524)
MEAKAKSLAFLSNEGLVKIPFFQRGYVWTKDNWEDLLTDLLNTTKTHFLGSLILKQQRTMTGEPKEVTVIDGQQRITTLSILIKVLYDTFTDDIKKNCETPIRNHLFHKRYQTDAEYLIKVQHSRVDAKAYEAVICLGIDGNSLESTTLTGNKILACYDYFRGELPPKSQEERKGLFNRLLDPENKMLVVIDLTEDDDEQAIFDTINSAGVKLSAADTIKNALFQKAIHLCQSQSKATDLYNRTWEKAFLADDKTIEFWETQRLTGRLMRDNMEILLHSIAVIKGFYDPDKHTLSELSKLYKKQISNYSSIEKLSEFVDEITAYAQLYRTRMLAFDDSTVFSFSDDIQRLFHILDVLQISTFHLFILFLFKSQNDDTISRLLLCLEKFIVRRMISKQEVKSYNKLCRDFIVNPELLEEKLTETTDDKLSTGLKEISNKNAALLLFWLELCRKSRDKKFDVTELKYNYSLEHLMPQKWEEHWKEMPEKKNPDGSTMSAEEAKKDRYAKIYWIGNMTLLTSSLNSSLQNHTFKKKMNGDGRKKGIKAYAALSITQIDIVSSFDSGDTVWDEGKIERRTANLTEEILDIWG